MIMLEILDYFKTVSELQIYLINICIVYEEYLLLQCIINSYTISLMSVKLYDNCTEDISILCMYQNNQNKYCL